MASESPRPLNLDIPFVEIVHADIRLPELNATSGVGFLSESTMENPLQGYDLSTTMDKGVKESMLTTYGGCSYQGEVALFPHYTLENKKKNTVLKKTKTK